MIGTRNAPCPAAPAFATIRLRHVDSGHGAIIREQLSAAGYDVNWARNRVEAGVLWQPSYCDVALLDLRRDPDKGEDLARRIQATGPAQRIIFLYWRNGTTEAA